MNQLHPNLRIASNLYRASALLTLVAYFLYETGVDALPELLILALTLGVAYLIRMGLRWLKWVLLVFEVAYLPFLVMALLQPWIGKVGVNIMSIVIDLIQIAALVFLFLPREEEAREEEEEEEV